MSGRGPALTWDDLATLYDKLHGGRKARTLPMQAVFEWAEKQTERFEIDPNEDTIHEVTT